MAHQTIINRDAAWPRLDRFLAAQLVELSRTRIQALIRAGRVTVNGEPVLKAREPLTGGEEIGIEVPDTAAESPLLPEAMDLDILHEDDAIVVVNKPAGLTCHPGTGQPSGTLANGLAALFKGLPSTSGALRPGMVHRLDKDTSGVIVVAKTESAHVALARQFERRQVLKTYNALVWGLLGEVGAVEEVDGSIARDPGNRLAFHVAEGGREAWTRFQVTEAYANFSLLEVRPRTGRTHQIRVHLTHRGHPIFGDALYGGKKSPAAISPSLRPLAKRLSGCLPRQALHAQTLQFEHPLSRKAVSYEAPLPEDFDEALSLLRMDNHG